MKKTVLDEDAYLYNQPKEKSEKETWKELSLRQKLRYFRDYYLLRVLIITAVAAFAGYMVWHTFLRKDPGTGLYVAVMNGMLDPQTTQELTEEMAHALGADESGAQIIFDDSYVLDSGIMKLQVYVASEQVDALIADRDTFTEYAGMGLLLDVRSAIALSEDADLLSEEDAFSEERFVWANGYGQEPEGGPDPELDLNGKGESAPYGIALTGSETMSNLLPMVDDPVIAFVPTGKHIPQAVLLAKTLLL